MNEEEEKTTGAAAGNFTEATLRLYRVMSHTFIFDCYDCFSGVFYLSVCDDTPQAMAAGGRTCSDTTGPVEE